MNKWLCALLAVILISLSLCSCTKTNIHGLSFTPDGGEETLLIHMSDGYEVYLHGGLALCTIEDSPKLLEMALDDGDITPNAILESAEEDSAKEKLYAIKDLEGRTVYKYEGFDLATFTAEDGAIIICFAPKDSDERALWKIFEELR
jgi:hypothetical protein